MEEVSDQPYGQPSGESSGGKLFLLRTRNIFLACGHSARDVFKHLYKAGTITTTTCITTNVYYCMTVYDELYSRRTYIMIVYSYGSLHVHYHTYSFQRLSLLCSYI